MKEALEVDLLLSPLEVGVMPLKEMKNHLHLMSLMEDGVLVSVVQSLLFGTAG